MKRFVGRAKMLWFRFGMWLCSGGIHSFPDRGQRQRCLRCDSPETWRED